MTSPTASSGSRRPAPGSGCSGTTRWPRTPGWTRCPVDDLPAFRGITLAINLASENAVDLAFARVHEVGGRIVKPAERTPWGGYSGYFADPDGHLWEIAFAPMFPPDEHGRIEIGTPAE